MMYTVTITPQAFRALEKLRLGRIQKNLLTRAIDSLANDPYRGVPLRRELKGFYKLRVGDYRIVYDILRERITVVVVGIGHRKDIYGALSRRAHLI